MKFLTFSFKMSMALNIFVRILFIAKETGKCVCKMKFRIEAMEGRNWNYYGKKAGFKKLFVFKLKNERNHASNLYPISLD